MFCVCVFFFRYIIFIYRRDVKCAVVVPTILIDFLYTTAAAAIFINIIIIITKVFFVSHIIIYIIVISFKIK